jgi:hypothetical protein
MQYVRGESLITILRRRGKLRFDECSQILRDIGLALEHAHANGIVHRDVKPHNILIDADKGVALLSDFGIAKASQGDAEVTATGMAIGTPAYMAPEQIDNGAVDGRADLYSLGVVGWEMLSGKRAWEGESLFGIIYKQKHHDLAPLTLLRPDTPQRLLLAMEGALQKDPARRWASASEFVEQLREDTPTSAMLRRREAAGALLSTGESRADPPAAGAATIPFRRADASAAAANNTGENPKVEQRDPVRPTKRVAALVAGSALTGAFAFYALFGANFERSSNTDAPRDSAPVAGIPRAEAAPAPRRPNAAAGTIGASIANAPGAPTIRRDDVTSTVATSNRASTTSAVRDVESPSNALPPGAPIPLGVRERVNPGSRALADAAIALLRSRQPDAARRLVDSALAMSPTDAGAYALRARANAARGDLRAAWADAEVAERLGEDWQAQTLIASFEAKVGETRAAEDRLAKLIKRIPSKVPFSAKQGSQLAMAYVAIGDTRRALNSLLRTRDDGSLGAVLKDPGFDAIRGEPRFRDILRAVAPDTQ